MAYLRTEGQFGGVVQGLLGGETLQELRLVGDVAAGVLEEPQGHGHVVQQDLSPGGPLGTPRDDLQQCPLTAACCGVVELVVLVVVVSFWLVVVDDGC